jgi:hypothetical protein
MRFVANQGTLGQGFVHVHLFFPVQHSTLIFTFTFMLPSSEGQAGAILELSKKEIFF